MERLAITIAIVFVARAISARVDEAVLESRATRPQPAYQQQLAGLLSPETLARYNLKPPTTLLQPALDSRPRATRSDLPPTRLGTALDLPPATRPRLAGDALRSKPTSEPPATRQRLVGAALAIGPKGTSKTPANRQPPLDLLPATRPRSRTKLAREQTASRQPARDLPSTPVREPSPNRPQPVRDPVREPSTDCAEMYREQQVQAKCGLHAVNNVIMNSIELPKSSRFMQESEMRLIAEGLLMPASPEGGFDYSVVFSALERRFKGSDVDINIVGGSIDGGFVPKTIEEHMAGLAETNASARHLGRGIAMSLDNAGWVVVNDANREHYYTYFRLNDYTFCNLDSVIQHDISGRVLPAREILQCELETLTFAAIIFPSPIPGIDRRSRQATPVFAEIRPLVEMGFSSDDSCKAYMKAGGNLELATDMLLGS